MFSSPQEQGILVFYSLCVGAAVEIVYEVFRFIVAFLFCISVNSKRKSKFYIIFRFLLDILFSLIYTVITVIFIYGANNGAVRYFILLFSAIGFLISYYTLGKLLSYLENRASHSLYRLIIFTYEKIRRLLRPVTAFYNSRRIKKYMLKRMEF